MDNQQLTTGERVISKARTEIITEAKRIEEALLYSSKGHLAAAGWWGRFHLGVGVPMVILASVSSATALAAFSAGKIIAGVCSIVVTVLSALMTFLNPKERSNTHLNAGNNYDSLMNKTRIFWSIDCWRDESEQVLTEKLKYLSEQKDRLNQNGPQIPSWAYRIAKRGIESGEGDYAIDAPKPLTIRAGDEKP